MEGGRQQPSARCEGESEGDFLSLGGLALSCGCRVSVLPMLLSEVIASPSVASETFTSGLKISLECHAFSIAKPDRISHSPLVASHQNTDFEDWAGDAGYGGTFPCGSDYQFPVAVTNCHKLGGLKQHSSRGQTSSNLSSSRVALLEPLGRDIS